MPIPVPLTVTTEPDGSWTVVVPRPPNEPARACIPAGRVRSFQDTARSAFSEGRSQDVVQALQATMELAAEPWRELASTLRAVVRNNHLAILCIQASGSAAEVPWELLTDSPRKLPLEVRGDAVVVRLEPNGTQPLDRAARRLRIRHPPLPAGDKAYDAPLLRACADAGVPGPRTMRLGETPADEALVLLLLDGLPQEVLWQRVVDHTRLAVVREGGPEALCRQGVAVATGPTRSFPALLEVAFLETLVATLANGAPLLGALAAARRSIRKQNGPWWSWRIAVGGMRPAVAGPLVIGQWLPRDWPQPGSDVVEILRIARDEGEAVGYVGVEQVLTGFEQAELRFGERAKHLRGLVGGCGGDAWGVLSTLHASSHAPDFSGTPRLRFLASELKPGFSAEELATALLAEPALADLLGHGPPAPSGVDARLPRLLEVLGGPEDGRVLEPQAGEVVGRHGKGARAQHGLYEGCRLTDRAVSRESLIWGKDGRVFLRNGGQVRRDKVWTALAPGDASLAVGDLLKLSPATRLRVLA